MNKIVRMTKELTSITDFAGIAFLAKWQVGDLFYVQPYRNVEGTNNYYPLKGGYPIWDRDVDMAAQTELVEETELPKEYFIDKKYSQYEVDQMINKEKKNDS